MLKCLDLIIFLLKYFLVYLFLSILYSNIFFKVYLIVNKKSSCLGCNYFLYTTFAITCHCSLVMYKPLCFLCHNVQCATWILGNPGFLKAGRIAFGERTMKTPANCLNYKVQSYFPMSQVHQTAAVWVALPDCTHRPDSAQTGLVLLRSSAAAHPWKRCHPHTLVLALHWKHFAVTRFGVSMQPGVQHSHFSHLKLWPFIASGRTFSCWVKRWVKVDPCSLYYLMFPY